MVDLSGIWIPLITPLVGDGVDVPATRRLVQHLVAKGVAGFVVCGSTGEAAMLDPDEQHAVLAATLAAAQGRPVWMGLSGTRPQRVLQRALQLTDIQPGVAGFLLTAPAYVKPSQAGIVDFFQHVADGSPRPLIVYDIPSRTGVRIELRSLLALAGHPRIVGVKDCSADRAAAEALLADGRLALLAGNDDELFEQLARGAVGGITASAHVATAAFVALQRGLAAGRLAEARDLWRQLAPMTKALFAEPNPAPLKAVLAAEGWIEPTLRAPMQPASPATLQVALAARDALTHR